MKKKIISLLLIVASVMLLSGCGCMKQTAKMAVERFLNQYRNLSANVITDMETVIDKENLTDSQKEKYREVLKKQYKDLRYEITGEKYEGDTALVDAKITVYDLYKVQKDANEYLTSHGSEFMSTNGVYSNELFMDYKLDNMKKAIDTIEYTITFKVTKDDDGNFRITDLDNSDLEKIHGIYNYDSD